MARFEAPHSLVQDLGVALHQAGSFDDVGVHPFPHPIVEREHVVAGGLEEEQLLQLGEFVGLLGGEVVGLGPVAGAVVQLPHVVGVLDLGDPGRPWGAVLTSVPPHVVRCAPEAA
jgi:hypothetical protein